MILIKRQCWFHGKVVLYLFRWESWVNWKTLELFCIGLITLKKRRRTSVQENDYQLRLDPLFFYSTVLFINMYSDAHYGAYYAKILKYIEELYSGNKKILSVSVLSTQGQERYPTRTAIDMQSEQTINRDAKTPAGIINFSTKHQCTNRAWASIVFLKEGGWVNFDYLARSVGNLKNFKRGVEVWCRRRSS